MAVRVCQQGRLRGKIQFLEVQEGLDDGRLLPVKEQELDESQKIVGQSQTLNKNPTYYCKGNLWCSDATKHVLAEGNPKLY